MGGYGSGRWGTGKPDAKTLADRCLALDIKLLVKARVVHPNVNHRGSWEWWKVPTDEKPSSTIGFEVRTGEDGGTLQLRYAVTMLKAGENRAVEPMLVSAPRCGHFINHVVF
jgi:hypothetical protein